MAVDAPEAIGIAELRWEAWLTLFTIVGIFTMLTFTHIAPDAILSAALGVLLVSGAVSIKDGLTGFSNQATLSIAALFIVGAGIRETGAITWIVEGLFGRPRSEREAIARVVLPTTIASGLTNNTPLVAMLIPAVHDWAAKNHISISKLLLPISYAAVLGGTCTLIGTSTNLMVDGLLEEHALPRMGMFEIGWIGLPCAVVGCGYLILMGPRLLPDRKSALLQLSDPREYTVEMLVEPLSPLVGQTIEQAGLRQLAGLYLMEIDREGQILQAVSPREALRANDRLVFVGIVDSVVHLQRIRGLVPATDQVFKLDSPRSQRLLIEAVVSDTCPLVGKSIRDGRFRSVFQAAVIAVARNGVRLPGKIGDIVLRPGDTLLVEALPTFVEQQRHSRDFFLVSPLENSTPVRHDRAMVALGLLLGMVGLVTFGWLPLLLAAILAAGLMVVTRCCTISAARRSINLEVLITIATSLGVAKAVEATHLDQVLTSGLILTAGRNEWLALAIIYVTTLCVTELITNTAAAALMFPFALQTAQRLGVEPMPFLVAIMLAASAAFASPIGYQTNLMVYGPGGYRLRDYVRLGVPLDLIVAVMAIFLIPRIWPF